VTHPGPGGPVVVDTSVFGADLLKVRAPLAVSYQPFLVGRAVFISFVTVAELRYGARRGHALSQRVHEADRWIASTALWLGVPLVAHDSVFREVPGLTLLTIAAPHHLRSVA
jgi:predicted nucleic acid-binding protein